MPPEEISYLPLRITVLAVTFCLSGFFSGSETALFSFQPDELARMKGRPGVDGVIARLRADPKRLLITILFGNMLVNVVFFSVSFVITAKLSAHLSRPQQVLFSFSSLLAIMLGGEVAPKNIAVSFYHTFGRTVAYPLSIVQRVLMPVVLPLERIADLVAGLLGGDGTPRMHADELKLLVDVGAREGVLDVDEGEMISDVIRLAEVRVSELMVPRVEMVGFDLSSPEDRLLALFRDSKLTMIPVYDRTRDNMRGLVHVKDVLMKRPDQLLVELVRPAPFIPETATVEEALRQCRDSASKTAFVVDEYGAVRGLVTIEDLLEEIVGEIADEYDVEVPPDAMPLDGGGWLVRGGMALREWEEMTGWEAPDLDVDTVGGLVMALLDKVPDVGDYADSNGLRFTVREQEGRRASVIAVTPDPNAPDNGESNGGEA